MTNDKSKFVISLEPGETTYDVISRLADRALKDSKSKTYASRNSYCVREFSAYQSIDREGRNVGCASYNFPRRELQKISPMFTDLADKTGLSPEDEGVLLNSIQRFDIHAVKLENAIGVPHLFYPKIKKTNIYPLPKADVEKRLERFRNRAAAEIKQVRQMFHGIDDCLNDKLVSAINVLHWILTQYTDNGIDQNGLKNILDELFKLIVARERDKLFYLRRHPSDATLHRCQDPTILSSIEQIVWVLGSNPFISAAKRSIRDYYERGINRKHGLSSFQ